MGVLRLLSRGGIHTATGLRAVRGAVCGPSGSHRQHDHRCGKCLLTPPPYERARAVGLYEGTLREVIHTMKYRPVFGLVRPLAELLGGQFAVHWSGHMPDALVPVHRLRRSQREFDQALALANGLGQTVGIPVWSDTLTRHAQIPIADR